MVQYGAEPAEQSSYHFFSSYSSFCALWMMFCLRWKFDTSVVPKGLSCSESVMGCHGPAFLRDCLMKFFAVMRSTTGNTNARVFPQPVLSNFAKRLCSDKPTPHIWFVYRMEKFNQSEAHCKLECDPQGVCHSVLCMPGPGQTRPEKLAF